MLERGDDNIILVTNVFPTAGPLTDYSITLTAVVLMGAELRQAGPASLAVLALLYSTVPWPHCRGRVSC